MRKSSSIAFARLAPILLPTLFFSSGCGLLLGNIRPVEEKSDQYGVADLAQENPKVWSKLTDSQVGADARDPETTSTEIPDMAFQSAKTAAVISINSSCRAQNSEAPAQGGADAESLSSLARQLTYGITNISHRVETNLTVQSLPALSLSLSGKLNSNDISLKAIVLKKNACVYDLLYMAPPSRFAENEPDFDHFVASLRLK